MGHRNSVARRVTRGDSGRSLCVLAMLAASGCSSSTTASTHSPSGRTIRVPDEAKTITLALTRAKTGDMVLISPGVYRGRVMVDKKDITIRGTDRNSVVIDGEGTRPEGIVVVADGVRIENLTVTSHTFNGVLISGLHDGATAGADGVDGYTRLDPAKYPPIQRFAIDSVTSYDNGLSGIDAFDSQHGTITNSYVSGAAGSGIHIEQCADCDIVVAGNVAERNAVGFENANASDSIVITGNRFASNRVGVILQSIDSQALAPQRANYVVGNAILDNNEPDSPAQQDGAFGVGIRISAGQDNVLGHNLVRGNSYAGLMFTNSGQLAATGNQITNDTIAGNGVDIADLSSAGAPSSGNCFENDGAVTAQPPTLLSASCPAGTPKSAGVATSVMPKLSVPDGLAVREVTPPPQQPAMSGDISIVPGALADTSHCLT